MNSFQNLIYQYYKEHGRVLPWRLTHNPYYILVSEIMLQQTQVQRVLGKYESFVDTFPDFPSLAAAPFEAVLKVWHGLGYNRRALALKKIAGLVTKAYDGALPSSVDALVTLPGIGRTTASAVAAFAFDIPVAFVETNIRTVFIHFFFPSSPKVSDREIMTLAEAHLDRDDPRKWHYALMDYGTMLKQRGERAHRKSASYHRQTPFAGSERQLRGAVLKLLVNGRSLSRKALAGALKEPQERVLRILLDLEREGFLRIAEDNVTLA
jgi:A/G-specific adenine glycosylase